MPTFFYLFFSMAENILSWQIQLQTTLSFSFLTLRPIVSLVKTLYLCQVIRIPSVCGNNMI